MSNQRISELTTSSVPIKATDFLEVSVFNGATYDTKKVNSEYLKPYKVYSALISQSGTSAPTVTILENTIGSIVWTRLGAGQYRGTAIGKFTANKTFLVINSNVADAYAILNRTSSDFLLVETGLYGSSPSDSFLTETSLEIRVYQ